MVKFVLNPVPPNMCFLTFFAEVTSFHSEVNFLGVYFIINLQFTLMKPTRTYKNVQDSPQNAGPLDCTLRKMRISLEQIAQCFSTLVIGLCIRYLTLPLIVLLFLGSWSLKLWLLSLFGLEIFTKIPPCFNYVSLLLATFSFSFSSRFWAGVKQLGTLERRRMHSASIANFQSLLFFFFHLSQVTSCFTLADFCKDVFSSVFRLTWPVASAGHFQFQFSVFRGKLTSWNIRRGKFFLAILPLPSFSGGKMLTFLSCISAWTFSRFWAPLCVRLRICLPLGPDLRCI